MEKRVPVIPSLYVRLALIIHTIALLVAGLIIGRVLLVPLCFAFLFALLLQPMCRWMENKGMSRVLAIVIGLFIILITVNLLLFFVFSQLRNLMSDSTELQNRLSLTLDQMESWISLQFGITKADQLNWIKTSGTAWLKSSSQFIGQALGATTHIFLDLLLLLIYMFFFLYYRSFFLQFLYRLFAQTPRSTIDAIAVNIRGTVKNYVWGLIIVVGIIAVLNVIGLYLLGIEYALFFGILGAILAIIPYIGVVIGAFFPVVISLITKDSAWYSVGVLGVFLTTNMLSHNFILPYIVGAKVNLNPFAGMLSLLAGGTLWGASGMVLAIPFLAILKILLDAIEPFKPFGFLLGSPPSKEVEVILPVGVPLPKQ